ncbi:MAG: C40 family peptidase [Bacteroidales bacterium]|nr:C40 family peptidase [Bacteroidales bacterium]
MLYGICDIAAIPMRAETSERSEMVSQLIFGDAYEVIDNDEKWLKIKTLDCQYEGWIDRKLYNSLDETELDSFRNAEKYFVSNYMLFIQNNKTHISFPVFAGASFPYPQNDTFTLGSSTFTALIPEKEDEQDIDGLTKEQYSLVRFASMFLNAPYLWGGRTPLGIDCSGFTQLIYKSVSIDLPRDASQQVNAGVLVDFVEETQAGDLAFFQNAEGSIIHVGMILEKNKILHASGKVRIDTIDQNGIFNQEMGKYTHSLRIIKRILK